MKGYWISFAVIALIVLFGVPMLKNWTLQKTKIQITQEMEGHANVRVVLYILFYWLCDLFYMSCFIDSLICKYIFGGLILIIIFMNLSKGVSYPKERNNFERFGMIQDFILGTGLSIYLIYIIPNKDIQNIVIPVISAVYGGLITLVGVALTIRKSDKDRKDDEIKKAKPLVFIVNVRNINSDKEKPISRFLYSKNARGTLVWANKKNKYYSLPLIAISNADYSHCVIIGYRINNDYHIFDVGQVLPKDSLMILRNDFTFNYKENIQYISLLIKDMLDNIYELELNVSIIKYDKEDVFQIESGIEIKPTTLNINPKEI